MVYQADKARPIDDGRKAGHNSAATMTETIVCQTGEFLVLALRSLVRHVLACRGGSTRYQESEEELAWPDWLAVDAGVED
eukprot:1693595-Heterocapsa_arctica.AAC.1